MKAKWDFRFTEKSAKDFSKLDKPIQTRIQKQIVKMTHSADPVKNFDAKPLNGPLKVFYRYRIGDYRMLCKIKKQEVIIEAIRIAHRRESYLKVPLS
ncbi:MAG: type II toxin-antitoxin system RelE/ParE family toxin [Alphaproteobacteria bacterium CG_4_10_14_0_8_um_filter_37_21]|nr:MAG: type II toxin-antitoxin system RelE/ParE family toxin [Alphaproteobacteria bacterium CG_4_10_14_0_8_um_filter_37_21]